MEAVVLCLDIGTSALKGALIDAGGKVHSTGARHFISRTNALDWEDALVDIARELRAARRFALAGIAISGHGPSLVVLGPGKSTMDPILFWMDHHSTRLDDQPSFFLPKIRWYMDQAGPDSPSVEGFISCPEYLAWKLGAEARTISPHPGFDPYVWTADQVSAYGIDPSLLPPMERPGSLLGHTGGALCERAGLGSGIPIYSGGSDFLMALLGTGTTRPGLCCDRAGSSEGINYCSAQEIVHPHLRTLPHVREGLWNLGAILPSSGLLFEWFRMVTGQKELPYQEMMRDITALEPGTDLPFFVADPQGCGRFHQGAFLGFEHWHGPAHLSRSVVESLGFMVREGLGHLSEAGVPPVSMRMCGGQAKNELWCQLKADISGCAIEVPALVDAELMGNGIVAWTGLGAWDGHDSAVDAMVRMDRTYEPSKAFRDYWTDRFRLWQEKKAALSGCL